MVAGNGDMCVSIICNSSIALGLFFFFVAVYCVTMESRSFEMD